MFITVFSGTHVFREGDSTFSVFVHHNLNSRLPDLAARHFQCTSPLQRNTEKSQCNESWNNDCRHFTIQYAEYISKLTAKWVVIFLPMVLLRHVLIRKALDAFRVLLAA